MPFPALVAAHEAWVWMAGAGFEVVNLHGVKLDGTELIRARGLNTGARGARHKRSLPS